MPPVLAFCSPAPWSRLCRRNVSAAATSSSAQLQLSPGTGSGTGTGQGNIPSLHSVTSHQHLQRMLHLAVSLLWAGWKHQVRSSLRFSFQFYKIFLSPTNPSAAELFALLPSSLLTSYYSCARGTSLHNLTSPSYLLYDRDAVKLSTA